MVFSSFFRRWREKRDTGIVATVKPQPEPPDEKIDPWFPPRDIHDPAAWDRYWQRRRDRKWFGFDYFSIDDFWPGLSSIVQCLIKRGAKTVLCAGNGVSLEPRVLAAAGSDVTAMDLSPLAVHLAETYHCSSEELDMFSPKEQWKPGGTLRFVIGDLLDRSVCPGPFDAIIERRMLQLFPEQERGLALDALASRLTADGLLLSQHHNQLRVWRSIVQLFRDRGWSFDRDLSGQFYPEDLPDHGGRVAWLVPTTG